MICKYFCTATTVTLAGVWMVTNLIWNFEAQSDTSMENSFESWVRPRRKLACFALSWQQQQWEVVGPIIKIVISSWNILRSAAGQRLFKWYRPGYQHQQRRGSELQPFHIIVDSASPLQDGRSWWHRLWQDFGKVVEMEIPPKYCIIFHWTPPTSRKSHFNPI